MKFDLHRPCANCPFRTDCPPQWLGKARTEGIAATLDGGNTFPCHKNHAQQCAGALITLKKAQGGFSGALALACAFGWLDYNALDLDAPVFDSFQSFIDHHTQKPQS